MSDKAARQPYGFNIKGSYRAESTALTRGYAVKAGTAEDQVKVAGADEACIGLVDETVAAAGDIVGVVEFGLAIGIAGDTLATLNAAVKPDSAGKLVSAAAADIHTIGYTRSIADALNDEVLIFVIRNHKRSA